jgi:hypothetical protein
MNALIALIIFIAIASPTAFRTTRNFIGDWIASPEGLATFKGLFFHGIVFLFLVFVLTAACREKSGYLTAQKKRLDTRDDQDDQNNTYFQKNRLMGM